MYVCMYNLGLNYPYLGSRGREVALFGLAVCGDFSLGIVRMWRARDGLVLMLRREFAFFGGCSA